MLTEQFQICLVLENSTIHGLKTKHTSYFFQEVANLLGKLEKLECTRSSEVNLKYV